MNWCRFLRVSAFTCAAFSTVASAQQAVAAVAIAQHSDLTITLGHDDGIVYIMAPPPPPPIHVLPGSSVKLVTGVESHPYFTTLWFKNDRPLLDGQPAEFIEIKNATPDDSGVYRAEIRLSGRIIYSHPATLRVTAPTRQPLLNLSTRGTIDAGNPLLIAGFVIAPSPGKLVEHKRVLLRAVGPMLASVGVSNALPAPQMRLFTPAGKEIELLDTGLAASAAIAVGAGPLDPKGRDLAYVVSLEAGVYAAHVSSADGASGDVVVEIYDIPDNALLYGPLVLTPPPATVVTPVATPVVALPPTPTTPVDLPQVLPKS